MAMDGESHDGMVISEGWVLATSTSRGEFLSTKPDTTANTYYYCPSLVLFKITTSWLKGVGVGVDDIYEYQ